MAPALLKRPIIVVSRQIKCRHQARIELLLLLVRQDADQLVHKAGFDCGHQQTGDDRVLNDTRRLPVRGSGVDGAAKPPKRATSASKRRKHVSLCHESVAERRGSPFAVSSCHHNSCEAESFAMAIAKPRRQRVCGGVRCHEFLLARADCSPATSPKIFAPNEDFE